MSSYNNIQKIKYTKTPSDIVSLHEYIMFEDSHAKEKYVVFKFSNNVNQRLFEFKFEVSQYNKDNELIEKSVVVHSNFVAEANDLFVPNAKLKVNFECQSLEVKLEMAAFDRVIWRDSEFSDNSYRFESYAENVAKTANAVPAADTNKQPQVQVKKKKPKQYKLGFNIRNIFRRNKAVFPAVFNVFLCVVFIALVVVSTFYFKKVTGVFVVDDYVVKESSSGYVTILSYSGKEDNIEIPAKLGDYYVTKIAGGAFRNSNIKGVEINTESSLTIEAGAFKDCSNLTTVTGSNCNTVILMESAFTNCKKLSTFQVPTAQLSKKCFDGTNNIKMLIFDRVLYYEDGAKLLEVFNGVDKIDLVYHANENYPDDFYE